MVREPTRITIGEHTPGKREPSNGTIRDLLDLAVRAAGAERGFVVSAASDAPESLRIVAAVNHRGDGRLEPSASVARAALGGVRHGTWIDPRVPRMTADSQSVRGLGLRRFAAVAVPLGGPRRAAVVVDSRLTPSADPVGALALLPEIAKLLAAPLRSMAPATGRSALEMARDCGLVGHAPSFVQAVERVARYARGRLPILITGESGSGKEGFAHLAHRAGAPVAAPFVPLNCAAVPESLVEAELFGSSRGAYTGADRDRPGVLHLADGGTLFLDEIGDMPESMQAKLLRVLQDGSFRRVGSARQSEVHVRIVAATHRDLVALIAAQRFRHDLHYRLAVLPVRVPPLRERLGDLPALTRSLLDGLARSGGVEPLDIEPAAEARLANHAWPGNVRELQSVLARASLIAEGGTIRDRDLEIEYSTFRHVDPSSEVALIEAALRGAGTVTGAARRIGWSRQKMYRRMQAHRIRLDAT